MAYAQKVFKVRNGKTTKQFTWRARYKLPDGTWGSEPGFDTKTAAVDWGTKQESAIKAGTWIDPALARAQFGAFARTFMAVRKKRGRTVETRWRDLEEHVLPKWEHTPLGAFNWFEVDSWQQTLTCADTTAGRCVSLMSTILTAAVDANHITVNPLFGRRRTKPSALPELPKQRKAVEDRWARPEDVLRLAERLGPGRGMHVLTTAFLGLRWGEGLGLHRDKVLLTRREPYNGGWFECPILRLDQEVAEYEQRADDGTKIGLVLQLEPLKTTESFRDVDVPPFLAVLLRYHLQDWRHPYVFCTPSGKFWRRGNWARELRPAADGRPKRERRQGVSERAAWEPIMTGLDMRALRHTADTYQAQIGVRSVLAHEQMGHALPGIKATYQHPTPEMRQQRLDGLQDIYERAMRNLGWATLWGRVDLTKRHSEDDLPNIAQMISMDDLRQARRLLLGRSAAL